MCLQRTKVSSPITTTPAPSAATAPNADHSTAAPSAGAISNVLAAETESEEYTIQATGQIEACFTHLKILDGLIYVHGGITAGVLSAASGDCYIGRTPRCLTEIRVVGDHNTPVLIGETNSSELQSARIYVKGTAGDKVLLIYRRP